MIKKVALEFTVLILAAIISEIELPANQSGIPMTYSVNGKQYIVVAVGAPGHPGELVALGLDVAK